MDEPKLEQKTEQNNGVTSEVGDDEGGFNTVHFIKFVLVFLIFLIVGFLILVGQAWYKSN